MKPTSALADLRREYHSAQGALNYWNNAASAAAKDVERHSGERQAKDKNRLAEFQNKARGAQQRLDAIKAQLDELDPQGAQSRQATALRNAINKTSRQLAELIERQAQQPAAELLRQRVTKKRAKLRQLIEAEAQLKAQQERAAQQQDEEDQAKALALKPYQYRPPFERPHSDLSHLATTAPQAPMVDQVGKQHRQAVLDGLQAAIDAATARGDIQEVERLAAAWIWQAELQADDQPGADTQAD